MARAVQKACRDNDEANFKFLYDVNKSIEEKIEAISKEIYGADIESNLIAVQRTKQDFEGDFTIVVFPFLRYSKKSPEQIDLMENVNKNVEEAIICCCYSAHWTHNKIGMLTNY